ncbi:hypothetical protein ABE438_09015 [Bosea sp. TWI1241]|uniref:hypothetical protein n=1 Tax=Bosea sp. TWI1241 TaxID=3148904 RepID=UPI00320872F5
MRIAFRASLLLLAALVAAGTARAAEEDCPVPEAAEAVVLAGADRHGDLLLADGRVLALAGLAPRQDAAERDRFTSGLTGHRGKRFRLAVLGAPDRWGRLPARLVPPEREGEAAQDLAVALLAAGAAQHLPEPGQPGCNRLWREAAARAHAPVAGAATGREEKPLAFAVVDGHDPAAMRRHAGRIVTVEGRIATVAERTRRTYLNFERRRGAGGSLILQSVLWRELQRDGWTASGLAGKRVRARGVVEGRDGLLVAIHARGALEMID